MGEITVNHVAVLTCALLSLLLGGIWYSPMLFYQAWKRESRLSDDQIGNANPLRTYGLAFVLAYLMAYNLAFFLGDVETDWRWGATAGFLSGFGWVAAMFTTIAMFEQRSWRYVLINCGYIVVYFTVIGLVLGGWR